MVIRAHYTGIEGTGNREPETWNGTESHKVSVGNNRRTASCGLPPKRPADVTRTSDLFSGRYLIHLTIAGDYYTDKTQFTVFSGMKFTPSHINGEELRDVVRPHFFSPSAKQLSIPYLFTACN